MDSLTWCWQNFPSGTSRGLRVLQVINNWNPVKDEVLAEGLQIPASPSFTNAEEDLVAARRELVLHDHQTQLPHISGLPAAPLAANEVITSAANMPEELLSVPDPSNDGSMIHFCVPKSSQAATASLQAPSGHIASVRTPNGSCADARQPSWRPCTGPLQAGLVSQTAGLIQEISDKPSPALLPVTCPTTGSTQPWKTLPSFLVGSLGSNVRHPDLHSSSDGQSAARESRRLGGYTFCGKPKKLACWLSDLCQHLPGVPVSDSQVWALGSGSHPYSAARLAGLQQLCT